MISEEELAQMRSDQELYLTDTCTVTRSDAEPTFNEVTGLYTSDPATTIFTGVCRISPMDLQQRVVLFGETARDTVLYIATFPFDAPVMNKDDVVTVTESADTQLIGRALEVHSVQMTSLESVRRVVLQEVR